MLTPREQQCLHWMSQGLHDKQTAKTLGISPHTVREHIESAKQKLGVETRGQMTLKALAWGLLVPDLGLMI